MGKQVKLKDQMNTGESSAEIIQFMQAEQNNESLNQLGVYLKMARTDLGLDLETIGTYLNIRSIYLEAIEDNNTQALPERVYVVGYIKAYASYLGLDPKEAVRIYKLENPNKPDFVLSHVPFQPSSPRSLPSQQVMVISLGLLGVFLIAGLFFSDIFKTKTPEASVPVAPIVETTNPVADMPELAATPLIDTEPEPVKLIALENSWIEIRNEDGKILVRKTLKAGQTYELSADDALLEEHTLTTGNAGGIKILVGDTEIPPLGPLNETRRRISLDPQKLLDMKPSS